MKLSNRTKRVLAWTTIVAFLLTVMRFLADVTGQPFWMGIVFIGYLLAGFAAITAFIVSVIWISGQGFFKDRKDK